MATYLKFGKIQGSVTAEGHKDWVDCKSVQFGVGRAVSVIPGKTGSRESSQPSISEVVITREMDASTPYFFTESVIGKGQKAEIHLVRTTQSGLETYMEYTLENTIVSGYSMSGGGDVPTETISLNFTKIEMKYVPYKPDGSKGSPVPAGYDMEKAVKV